VLKKVIASELKEIQKVYGDARRTEIIEEQDEIRLEDLIAVQDVVITISHSGYTKRTPLSIYRQAGTRRQGPAGDEDARGGFRRKPLHRFHPQLHPGVTNSGKLYWLKVYEIPDVGAAGKGKHILNLVNLSKEEKVAAVLAVKRVAGGSEGYHCGWGDSGRGRLHHHGYAPGHHQEDAPWPNSQIRVPRGLLPCRLKMAMS